MPLSLEQYATWLDGRKDLLWPAAPEVTAPKAKPHLKQMPEIKVVSFSVYWTLLAITTGSFQFVHPQKLLMETALEKTIQEFKMWQSMSRKPGKPSEYMLRIYEQLLSEIEMARATAGERYPEIGAHEIWERVVKRLVKNEYQYDAPFLGSVEQLSEKISFFFHSSLQVIGAQPHAVDALKALMAKGISVGLLADGQCFTTTQLVRALNKQSRVSRLSEVVDPELVALSYEVGAKKPSERLYRAFVARLAARNIAPSAVLHIGPHLPNDVVPARRLGFHTGLYAGDKSSVVANNQQLNDPTLRPDVMITDLRQLVDMVG